ncbi:MAG: SPFH domain-containing protein [Planctomycetota bacterium]
MVPVIFVVIFVCLVFFQLIFVARRIIRVPPNRLLVIYGMMDHQGRAHKVVKSGAAFVWPLVQDYAWLSTEPITVDFPNGDRLVVQVGSDEPTVNHAAEQLLGLRSEEILQLVRDHLLQAAPDANLDDSLAKIGLVRSDL